MRKKILTIASVCLVLALAILPLASCGEVTPTPTPEPGPGPTPGPGPVTPEPPTGEPQYGGILKVGLRIDPRALGDADPMKSTNEHFPASPCAEHFFYLDRTGTVLPCLATSWEEDPEAATVTLHLREGVKFHDGTDFNAEAAKWNLGYYAFVSPNPHLKIVESIDVLGDYTVRLNLAAPDNTLVSCLANFAGLVLSPTAYETYGQEWAGTHPVGTGPFKFVSWERDVSIKYERFDDYWGGKPYLDGIEFIIIADPLVQMASFYAGEVDIIAGVSPKDAKDLEAMGKYHLSIWKHTSLSGLWAGASYPGSLFTDVRSRQAVSYAINNQSICDTFGYGYWEALNQPAYKAEWGYNPDVVGYPYNPEKARQLLTEAGYPDGFATELIALNTPEDKDVATAIQSYLKDVGIDAEISVYDRGRYYSVTITEGWGGLALGGMGANVPDVCFRVKVQFRSDTPIHKSSLRPPELDDLIYQALRPIEFNSKKALAGQAMKYAIDNVCVYNPVYGKPYILTFYPYVQDGGCLDTWWGWTWAKVWLGR